jgi:hypothetical protein
MKRATLFLALVLVVTGALSAQSFTGDFIISGSLYSTSDAVFRIARSNFAFTTLTTGIVPGSGYYAWEVIMAENNRDFYVLAQGGTSTAIVRMDPAGTILTTVYHDTSNAMVNAANLYLDQNGKLIVYDTATTTQSFLFEVDPATGVMSTVATLPRGDSLYGSAARNIDTGDHLVYVYETLFGVDRLTGASTSLVVTGTSRVARMGLAQDTLTGKAYGGTCCSDTMWELDIASQTGKVLVGAMGFHGNYGLKFERRVDARMNRMFNVSGHFSSGTNGISLIDTAGVVTSVFFWNAGTGTPMPYSVEIEGSLEVQPILKVAPNGRQIRLSFPGHAGKSYVSAVGISGIRPGIPLGDGRVINLALDSIAIASLQGALDPFLPNRVGILNASGEGVTALDVNLLGNAIQGLSVVFQTVVLDPNAPKGIAVVAEPYVIRME